MEGLLVGDTMAADPVAVLTGAGEERLPLCEPSVVFVVLATFGGGAGDA
jgi:hypothetical protein